MRNLNGSKIHPAPFSKALLPVFDGIIPRGVRVLDPMAGNGKAMARALQGRDLVGIEIDPTWAEMEPWVMQGDATALPFPDGSFEWALTSPTYANRMADSHNAQEVCRACQGTGIDRRRDLNEVDVPCGKCGGAGKRSHTRITYTHRMGEPLHERNTATLGWTGKKGKQYRSLHVSAWKEVRRVLGLGGNFVLNVSDHVRNHEIMPVTDWHVTTLEALGFVEAQRFEIETPRMRAGSNREARVPFESVIHFRVEET